MFISAFKGKRCILQKHINHGDEILFKSGHEFVMTGNMEASISKTGHIIHHYGILPSEQQHDPSAEISVDAKDLDVYS